MPYYPPIAKGLLLVINVRDYGAAGNGSTDDTNAIQTALNLVPAGGATVFIPAGTYKITAALSVKNNTLVLGDGSDQDIAVSGCTVISQVTAGAAAIVNSDQVNGNKNITVMSIAFNGSGSSASYGVQFVKAVHSAVWWCSFNGFKDRSVDISDAASIENVIGYCRIQKGTGTASVGYGIRFQGVSDSVIVGVEIAGGGVNSGTAMDSILIDGGGFIQILACRLYLDGGAGIRLSNSVFNQIIGNRVNNSGGDGIRIDNAPSNNNVVVGNVLVDNSQRVVTTYDGVSIATGCTGNIIVGNRCTDRNGTNQRYGISEAGTADFNTIEGNDVRGNVTGGILPVGAHTICKSNLGFNPQGVAAITVTASPFTYTNIDSVAEHVTIDGGTITTIVKDTVTLYSFGGTAARCAVWLEPNEAVTITYTVAPTMKKDRK